MRFVLPILATLALLVLGGCKRSETVDASQFNASNWEEKIKRPSLTEAEFTRLYAQAAAAELKNAEVKITGGRELSIKLIDGTELKSFLDNAWNEAKTSPTSRPEIVSRYLKALVAAAPYASALAGQPDTNSIVAVIRDDLFLQQFDKFRADKINQIISEKLVADLNILYAIDSEGSIAYFTETNRVALNLELIALRPLAMTNLKRLVPKVNRQGLGPVFRMVADGNYESSLLLAENLWDDQAKAVQGEIVAAVPSRDVLMFTGSASTEGLRELRAAAANLHANGSRAISATLIVRRNGRWEKFSE
jgi:uncharacterized protein YtpQ (UPF0354 family)